MGTFKDFWTKKTLVGLGLGQFLSLLITSTGFSSSELAKKGLFCSFFLFFSILLFEYLVLLLLVLRMIEVIFYAVQSSLFLLIKFYDSVLWFFFRKFIFLILIMVLPYTLFYLPKVLNKEETHVLISIFVVLIRKCYHISVW